MTGQQDAAGTAAVRQGLELWSFGGGESLGLKCPDDIRAKLTGV